jgi:molecular chaperone GrpE
MKETTHPMKPEPSEEPQDLGPTIDLDAAELDEVKDLQAFADAVAESTPEPGMPGGGATNGNQEATLINALKRIAELEKQEAEQKDKHHRLLADFANHRNRVSRETQLAVILAEKKLLLELLPVVDNFERCLSSKVASVEDFHDGVELIYRQFQEALRKAGVEGLDVKVGDPFDAMHAEALTTTMQPELPDGAVAAVFERGYLLKDQLLRPARVIVNHSPTSQEPPDAGGTVQ